MTGWLWQAIENSALQVTNEHKQFTCLARNLAEANTQYDARIWTVASFLLTYDPARSALWEEFATPSGLHVMPESQLVALNPVVAQPSVVTQLQTSTGAYGREFKNCYVKGVSVGPCAVAIAIDYGTPRAFPWPGKYHHTLVLSGNGVLDGGSLSTTGPPPPATIPAFESVVVFQ
jgi:hypothetical protein